MKKIFLIALLCFLHGVSGFAPVRADVVRDTYGRTLSWEGVSNVRDLGGLPAAGGGRLRWKTPFLCQDVAVMAAEIS